MTALRVDKFWYAYFLVRLFYLFFAVLVFPHLTTFGDPISYMTRGIPPVVNSSTSFMHLIGGSIGALLGGFNPLSNFPFMLLSFGIIRYTVEKLQIRKYVNEKFLFVLISLPSFCIWTSICSKETIGLFFSCILGLLIVRYLDGKFKLKWADYLSLFLCGLFKPQYLPFILSTLVYVFVMYHLSSKIGKVVFSVFYLATIVYVIYLARDLIDWYSFGVQKAFDVKDADYAASTRNTDIFTEPYDYFRKAPFGMLTAFFGPTLGEALRKPFHMAVFVESLVMTGCFVYLAGGLLRQVFIEKKLNIVLVTGYFVLFTGILFVHYPFGIFNSGSATRYRNNFLFLFIILLMYLYIRYKKEKQGAVA